MRHSTLTGSTPDALPDRSVSRRIGIGQMMHATDIAHTQDDDAEVVKGLSGDEVDPNLIIAGGRRSRRGRAQFGTGSKYQYQAKNGDNGDDDDDEW